MTYMNAQRLKGKVFDKVSKESIADVHIKLIGKSSSAKTDQKGEFDLRII